MNKDNIIFIGMDTHKEFCEVAYCLDDRLSSPQSLGRITTTKQAITKMARQFQLKITKFKRAQVSLARFRLCLKFFRLNLTDYLTRYTSHHHTKLDLVGLG